MAVDTDLVRILIGDTDPDTQLLSDDQISAICDSFSSTNLAAAACADALAAKFSRSVSFSLEGLRIDNSQKAQAYLALAQRLRAQATLSDAGGLGVPTVSGTSKSEVDAIDHDDDREPNRFKIGMMDYPGTTIPTADQDD